MKELLMAIIEGLGLGALLFLVCASVYARALSEWCIFTVPRCRRYV